MPIEIQARVIGHLGKCEDLRQRIGLWGWKDTELHRTPIVRHGSYDDTCSDPGDTASLAASADQRLDDSLGHQAGRLWMLRAAGVIVRSEVRRIGSAG